MPLFALAIFNTGHADQYVTHV